MRSLYVNLVCLLYENVFNRGVYEKGQKYLCYSKERIEDFYWFLADQTPCIQLSIIMIRRYAPSSPIFNALDLNRFLTVIPGIWLDLTQA